MIAQTKKKIIELQKEQKFKRTEPRFRLRNTEFIISLITSSLNKFNCDIINYSSHGMCLRYNGIYDIGEVLRFSINNSNNLLYEEFEAEIMYRNNNYYGLKFKSFNPHLYFSYMPNNKILDQQ